MKSICKTFSEMGVTFHDESNDDNYSIIGYSDATVPSSDRTVKGLIRFFRVPSA